MEKNYEFIPPHQLKTAVLFLVFNRLDTSRQVFETIRKAKPPRLYIAADGARESKEDEKEKVQAVRDFIISHVDWECEVKTLFREENLGCKIAVSSAIDWFFDNEEKGIILEDDCLPSQSFFWFCEELLDKYKDDLRVWHICGDNFQDGVKRGDADYYFSKYIHVWGWASWANRWKSYDVEIKSFEIFKENNLIKNIWKKSSMQKSWMSLFEYAHNCKFDTCWDYQWVYTCWINSGLSIMPNKNLIKNIGFGVDATNTINEDSEMSNLEYYDLSLPLKHNNFILSNTEADIYTFKKESNKGNIFKRVINKISRIMIGKNTL